MPIIFLLVAYTYDDSGDTALNDFNINASPSYLFSTISDILSVNEILKIHVCPWSTVRKYAHGIAQLV